MDYGVAAEAAGAARETGGYWQLALILAAVGFLGLFARWRKARQGPVQTAREIRARDEDPDRYRSTADKALVELLETSRSLNAQVDTKIRLLNRLVKDAGEMCERLEGLLRHGGSMDPDATRHMPEMIAAVAAASSDDTVVLPPKKQPRFLSDLHERIYRLRGEGHSAAAIAKATNLSTTEVEFIIHTFPAGDAEEEATARGPHSSDD